jgi:hypothetical protein
MTVPSLTTNLLAMPQLVLSVITGTNEDWIDSILYTVDVAGSPQLDLHGIEFNMEVRRRTTDEEVVLRASTKDSTLLIGDHPNAGYLIINVDHATMKLMTPGLYFADIVGTEPPTFEFVRRCVTITLEIVQGITRP